MIYEYYILKYWVNYPTHFYFKYTINTLYVNISVLLAMILLFQKISFTRNLQLFYLYLTLFQYFFLRLFKIFHNFL